MLMTSLVSAQVIDRPRKGYVSDYYVSCGGLCPVREC